MNSEHMMLSNLAPYARSAVRLLQGPVFEDQPEIWSEIRKYQVNLSQYFEKIAVELIVDTRDGYAYLRQVELDDNGSTIGLVRRNPLSYDFTIICVLLREWLIEFESDDVETSRLYITPKAFRDRVEMFFEEKANEMKFIRDLNRYFDQCCDMGFLKLTHKTEDPDASTYEVRRIIKARVTSEELERFRKELENEL